MADLSALSVTDVHAHPFLDRGAITTEQFTNFTAFGGGSQEFMEQAGIEFTGEVRGELLRVKQDTLYFRRLIHDLAGYFGCDPTLDAVVGARDAAVASDGYTEYVRKLYADAGLEAVVFDFGVPLPQLDVAEVSAQLPITVAPIFRIEPLIAELLKTDYGWAEFKRTYDDTIDRALTQEGFLGLKSIIAYRTGLDVSPLSRNEDQGFKALDAIRRGLGGGSMKMLRDYLLCRAMEHCMEHDVPMQIHTGMGDFEVNLVLCRPAYLMDLLRFPTFRSCNVILVHGGYPYSREAGYMANVLPRVYCDVSEGIPFAAHGARSIFSEILEMTPVSKVVYGSDGYTVPEIIYTSAKLGKQALGQVLDGLVDDGFIGKGDVEEIAGMILAGTANRLYKIG